MTNTEASALAILIYNDVWLDAFGYDEGVIFQLRAESANQ